MADGPTATRIGSFTLRWGESVVWDDRRSRLLFVDCAAQTLHWLDGADGDGGDLQTQGMPSMPTGIVPTDDGRLVAVLDDGLHVVDPDAGTVHLLAAYPDELDGRCNDACADLDGNLITGKLNMGPGDGAAWWFSATEGWRLLAPGIANTNGRAVGVLRGGMTLVVGDTSADYLAFPYDPSTGTVGEGSVFGDVSGIDGHPDGATLDEEGGLWAALVGGGQLARFTVDGLDRTVPLDVPNPTDVTFGGPDLDRLYVVSIGMAADAGPLEGALLVVDGLGVRGRPEPRFRLA